MFLTSTLMKPIAMHIPDGFLSVPVSLVFWLASLLMIALSVRRSRDQVGERQIPLLGVMAAFIFAAQMINFPVAGGTSGHLLGGALAGIALGPWAGILVMTSVIGVQALLFQDGGLLALGANIFNMGVLTVLIGYGLYRIVVGGSQPARLALAGLAAWLSVMAAALGTSLQLWLSGTASLRLVLPAMLSVHALIGIGEALITVAALAFLLRVRPESIQADRVNGGRGWLVVGLLVSIGVVLLAPLASANPDGLERVAQDLGFLSGVAMPPFDLLPDYTIPYLGPTSISTLLAGIAGVLIVAAVILLVARLFLRSAQRSHVNK